MAARYEIHHFVKDGVRVVEAWLLGLKDKRAAARIIQRLDRLELGNLGDVKAKGAHAMPKDQSSVPHAVVLKDLLASDPEFAAEYLNAAIEDTEEPRALLLALRNLAEALGMQNISEMTGVNRESLYRILSQRGNPTLRTLNAILHSIGLKLAAVPIQQSSGSRPSA